jgi:hypothetical protein
MCWAEYWKIDSGLIWGTYPVSYLAKHSDSPNRKHSYNYSSPLLFTFRCQYHYASPWRVIGSAVALQARKSRVRFPMGLLECFIALTPPADSASDRNEYQQYLLAVKVAGA